MLASTSMAGRTVSNRVAALLMQYAEKAGVGPAEFANRTGIGAADVADPAGRIDAERHRRTVELCAGLPLQPLKDEDAVFDYFPELGNLCLNARDLREALAAFTLCRPMVGEFDFLLGRHADGVVRIEYIAEFAPTNNFQALANFYVLSKLVRAYDVGIKTRFGVELTGNEPAAARHVGEMFGSQPRFGCAANRMYFAAPHLDAPFADYNAKIAPMLERQARQELDRIQRRHRFSANVESLIRELIADPSFDLRDATLLQQICARLDTSRWSINRRLQEEGTTFRELELEVRLDESRRLLRDTQLSLAEISDHTGFASQSAFSRFFRAQHGMPPQTWRQSHRDDFGVRA